MFTTASQYLMQLRNACEQPCRKVCSTAIDSQCIEDHQCYLSEALNQNFHEVCYLLKVKLYLGKVQNWSQTFVFNKFSVLI